MLKIKLESTTQTYAEIIYHFDYFSSKVMSALGKAAELSAAHSWPVP